VVIYGVPVILPVVAQVPLLTLSNNISISKECNIRASAYIQHLKEGELRYFPLKGESMKKKGLLDPKLNI
jgi:hypothetical protein